MKKQLLVVTTLLLVACGTTSNGVSTKNADNPRDYCRFVGGEVKTVNNGNESFCVLPGGDVVKLQEFYDNNH